MYWAACGILDTRFFHSPERTWERNIYETSHVIMVMWLFSFPTFESAKQRSFAKILQIISFSVALAKDGTFPGTFPRSSRRVVGNFRRLPTVSEDIRICVIRPRTELS